jgi:hypothetical protein
LVRLALESKAGDLVTAPTHGNLNPLSRTLYHYCD